MKFLVALDSFKGALTSQEGNQAIEQVLLQHGHQVISFPIADGGEGSLQALKVVPGWQEVTTTAHNLRGEMVTAWMMVNQQTVVIEVAELIGIQWVNADYPPQKTSSYGLGELIRFAITKMGAREIVLMLGGTGVVDGGIGLGEALGIRYYDLNHQLLKHVTGSDLGKIAAVDVTRFEQQIADVSFVVGSDVDAPLTGKLGAVRLFGPQKGIAPQDITTYEEWMCHYAKVCGFPQQPGDGAAGGLGYFARCFFKARVESGFDYLVKAQNWAKQLATVDVVITGEGKMDEQSLLGKLPVKIAAYTHKPTIALVGQLQVPVTKVQQAGLWTAIPISQQPSSLQQAMAKTKDWLQATMEEILSMIEVRDGFKKK